MTNPVYPFTLYNKDGAGLQVNNDKERDTAKAKGYGPKYVHSSFPKVLYRKADGGTVTVNDEGELQAKVGANGEGEYSEDYVAPPAPKVELPREPSSDDTSTVRALLAEIHDMKNRQDVLEERIEDLEVAAAKAAKATPATKAKSEQKGQ